MEKSIMPECYADTLLIQTLVPSKRGYNHKHSCFKVENAMTQGELKDKFAVGIIDDDKRTVGYLEEHEKLDEVAGKLVLWKHKDYPEKHHFLIQICPALEKWVLNVCEEEEIAVDYDLEGLKKITKSMASLEDRRLKKLFQHVSDKNGNESVRKLKGWVKLLCERNYQVDLNELKNV